MTASTIEQRKAAYDRTAAPPISIADPKPAQSAALAGSVSASTMLGPFQPDLARAIWVTLSGAWVGRVQLLRSVDGGATKLPLTVAGQPWANFTGNANEIAGEETTPGARYYLSVTLTSGTLTYRVAQ